MVGNTVNLAKSRIFIDFLTRIKEIIEIIIENGTSILPDNSAF